MENQLNSQLSRMLLEYETLEAEVETYETQSYQELVEEIQCIKQSNEYVMEAGKDPQHYLRVQVAEMESRAPKLKRYERVKINIKKSQMELSEIQKFQKANNEDLQRLKIREKYLLNQSIDSFGVVAPSMDDAEVSQDFVPNLSGSQSFDIDNFKFTK